MAKSQKQYDQEQPAQESNKQNDLISIESVKNQIEYHNDTVLNKVKYHLKMVKQSTGEITEEDVAYVISLSNRELLKELDDVLANKEFANRENEL